MVGHKQQVPKYAALQLNVWYRFLILRINSLEESSCCNAYTFYGISETKISCPDGDRVSKYDIIKIEYSTFNSIVHYRMLSPRSILLNHASAFNTSFNCPVPISGNHFFHTKIV